MHRRPRFLPLLAACMATALLAGCDRTAPPTADAAGRAAAPTDTAGAADPAARLAADYAVVPLTADLSGFDDDGKRMLARLVEASQVMDELFWAQSWSGDRDALLARASDDATRTLLDINYGPWDRLNGDAPLLDGI